MFVVIVLFCTRNCTIDLFLFLINYLFVYYFNFVYFYLILFIFSVVFLFITEKMRPNKQ